MTVSSCWLVSVGFTITYEVRCRSDACFIVVHDLHQSPVPSCICLALLLLALLLPLAVVVAFGAVHLQVLAKALSVPATPRGVVRDAELGDRTVQPRRHDVKYLFALEQLLAVGVFGHRPKGHAFVRDELGRKDRGFSVPELSLISLRALPAPRLWLVPSYVGVWLLLLVAAFCVVSSGLCLVWCCQSLLVLSSWVVSLQAVIILNVIAAGSRALG
jgi:hypothetical protein